MAKKKVVQAKNKRQSPGVGMRIFLLLLFLPFFIVSMPSVIFLLFALFPSIVAIIASNRGDAYRWLCIGAMNLAGTMPFLFRLWFYNHSFEGAVDILFNLSTVLVIYGSAALGLFLYHAVPVVVEAIIALFMESKIRRIQAEQEDLIETWGAGIVSVANKVLKKKGA